MTLGAGDLLFVGWDSDNDDISFIATTAIAAGEVIYFTDNEWTGTAFNNFNEGLVEWTVPAGGIPAGTVVDLNIAASGVGGGTASISQGTLSVVDGIPNIAGANEMFWAFQGTPQTGGGFVDTNFVAVIANETTGSSAPNLTGTGLTTANGAVIIDGDNDYMEWTGDAALPDPVLQQDLIASILDTANTWTTADGPFNSNPNGTGFDIAPQSVICFARGTRIETARAGEVSVEDLTTGTDIATADHTTQTIRWIGHRKFDQSELALNPKLRPVRIRVGALGRGLPRRDLLVSRQHRMLVSSKIAARVVGATDVLVPAIKLAVLPGIYVDETVNEVEYFHVLFDQHEVIYAEGAPSESFYTGRAALTAISSEARDEILAIFPELADRYYVPPHAAIVPSQKSQNKLVARHRKNNTPVLDQFQ